ncbi:MAG: glycosyltransferase [Firmicutes bacterium]|jgi:glycosyltransferase involved in cell wall biosynthesis|nr:glycosyltransferase [Bacillota bacterium]MDH7495750.1 glycosyltransferase [Bacillota bacterium]
MRVLLQSRGDLLALPAGDTVQILETKKALGGLGVDADHSGALSPALDGYDLVHLFNLTRVAETAAQCENAVRAGKPVVVSPIYWNPEEYIMHENPRQRSALLKFWRQDNPLRRRVVESAAMLLPNAESEAWLVHRDLGVDAPFRVVPNGADPSFSDADPQEFVRKFGMTDFVLCCARISPRKNQLALIRATRGLGLPVVFIGPVNDPFYYEACRNEADAHVHFLGSMPQREIAAAYVAARVHVLPSWFETPGLASLEAAMAGCNVVSTDRGTAREYFGDLAWYCDPSDLDSIRTAILAAYGAPRRPELAALVKQNFTWERAAQATVKAYKEVLGADHRK